MTKHLGRSGPQDEATAGPVNASALDVSGIHMHPMLQWLKLGRHLEPSMKTYKNNMVLEVPLTKDFSRAHRRCTNRVLTSKYSVWSFVPKVVHLQCRKFTHAFYLLMTIISCIGYYGHDLFTTVWSPSTLAVMVAVMLLGVMISEGHDDFVRHKIDNRENSRLACRVRNQKLETCACGELLPGDLVVVDNREAVPADLILVYSSTTQGNSKFCHVVTASIDGETNLKTKQVLQELQYHEMQIFSEKEIVAKTLMDKVKGTFCVDPPNNRLQLEGTFTSPSGDTLNLNFKNLILRGSVVRNTRFIVGIVIYAGKETKLELSKKRTPSKFGRIDIILNRIMMAVFLLYLTLVIGSVAMFQVYEDISTLWYFQGSVNDDHILPIPIANFLTFANLYYIIIPFPLFIALEFSNHYASYVVRNDHEMYDENTDTAASCSTTNLVAETGQITHVFADKTGTLTKNEMTLTGAFINGEHYGTSQSPCIVESLDESMSCFNDVKLILNNPKNSIRKQKVYDFFVMLALCHTVVLDEEGEVNAESADEEAFLAAAKDVGIELQQTDGTNLVLKTPDGLLKFEVLLVNEFSSERKRMSVVVRRTWNETIVLLMKGADSTVVPLLRNSEKEKSDLKHALDQYARSGLRTMVMAKKDLSPGFDPAYLECDLDLIGGTSVEDCLQDGVPEAVQLLRDAGVQLWVLTGDKIETAINVGLSSNILQSNMYQVKLVSNDQNVLVEQIDKILGILNSVLECEIFESGKLNELERLISVQNVNAPDTDSSKHIPTLEDCIAEVALICSGVSLELLLARQLGNEELQAKLLKLARACKVVMACRVSPVQKSLLVEMVRYAKDVKSHQRPAITLAIGDGANDVPMIQSAHVGVGISGHEGLQASNSSDFSIAKFSFLTRLMLIHGRWTYRRQANLIVYATYAFMTYAALIVAYNFLNLFSGQIIYYAEGYTVIFGYLAIIPISAHSFFDKDLSDARILCHPWVYYIGVESKDLNRWTIQKLVMRAMLYSTLLFISIFCIAAADIDAETLGACYFTSLIMLLFTMQAIHGTSFTSHTFFIFGAMIVVFIVYMLTQGPAMKSRQVAVLWIYSVGALVIISAVEMACHFVKSQWKPSALDILMEIDRGYYLGEGNGQSRATAFKVLNQIMKLSVAPISLGIEQIKRNLNNHPDNVQLRPFRP